MNKVCINKKIVYLLLIVSLIFGAIYLTNNLNSQKLSYKSSAAIKKIQLNDQNCGKNNQKPCVKEIKGDGQTTYITECNEGYVKIISTKNIQNKDLAFKLNDVLSSYFNNTNNNIDAAFALREYQKCIDNYREYQERNIDNKFSELSDDYLSACLYIKENNGNIYNYCDEGLTCVDKKDALNTLTKVFAFTNYYSKNIFDLYNGDINDYIDYKYLNELLPQSKNSQNTTLDDKICIDEDINKKIGKELTHCRNYYEDDGPCEGGLTCGHITMYDGDNSYNYLFNSFNIGCIKDEYVGGFIDWELSKKNIDNADYESYYTTIKPTNVYKKTKTYNIKKYDLNNVKWSFTVRTNLHEKYKTRLECIVNNKVVKKHEDEITDFTYIKVNQDEFGYPIFGPCADEALKNKANSFKIVSKLINKIRLTEYTAGTLEVYIE